MQAYFQSSSDPFKYALECTTINPSDKILTKEPYHSFKALWDLFFTCAKQDREERNRFWEQTKWELIEFNFPPQAGLSSLLKNLLFNHKIPFNIVYSLIQFAGLIRSLGFGSSNCPIQLSFGSLEKLLFRVDEATYELSFEVEWSIGELMSYFSSTKVDFIHLDDFLSLLLPDLDYCPRSLQSLSQDYKNPCIAFFSNTSTTSKTLGYLLLLSAFQNKQKDLLCHKISIALNGLIKLQGNYHSAHFFLFRAIKHAYLKLSLQSAELKLFSLELLKSCYSDFEPLIAKEFVLQALKPIPKTELSEAKLSEAELSEAFRFLDFLSKKRNLPSLVLVQCYVCLYSSFNRSCPWQVNQFLQQGIKVFSQPACLGSEETFLKKNLPDLIETGLKAEYIDPVVTFLEVIILSIPHPSFLSALYLKACEILCEKDPKRALKLWKQAYETKMWELSSQKPFLLKLSKVLQSKGEPGEREFIQKLLETLKSIQRPLKKRKKVQEALSPRGEKFEQMIGSLKSALQEKNYDVIKTTLQQLYNEFKEGKLSQLHEEAQDLLLTIHANSSDDKAKVFFLQFSLDIIQSINLEKSLQHRAFLLFLTWVETSLLKSNHSFTKKAAEYLPPLIANFLQRPINDHYYRRCMDLIFQVLQSPTLKSNLKENFQTFVGKLAQKSTSLDFVTVLKLYKLHMAQNIPSETWLICLENLLFPFSAKKEEQEAAINILGDECCFKASFEPRRQACVYYSLVSSFFENLKKLEFLFRKLSLLELDHFEESQNLTFLRGLQKLVEKPEMVSMLLPLLKKFQWQYIPTEEKICFLNSLFKKKYYGCWSVGIVQPFSTSEESSKEVFQTQAEEAFRELTRMGQSDDLRNALSLIPLFNLFETSLIKEFLKKIEKSQDSKLHRELWELIKQTKYLKTTFGNNDVLFQQSCWIIMIEILEKSNNPDILVLFNEKSFLPSLFEKTIDRHFFLVTRIIKTSTKLYLNELRNLGETRELETIFLLRTMAFTVARNRNERRKEMLTVDESLLNLCLKIKYENIAEFEAILCDVLDSVKSDGQHSNMLPTILEGYISIANPQSLGVIVKKIKSLDLTSGVLLALAYKAIEFENDAAELFLHSLKACKSLPLQNASLLFDQASRMKAQEILRKLKGSNDVTVLSLALECLNIPTIRIFFTYSELNFLSQNTFEKVISNTTDDIVIQKALLFLRIALGQYPQENHILSTSLVRVIKAACTLLYDFSKEEEFKKNLNGFFALLYTYYKQYHNDEELIDNFYLLIGNLLSTYRERKSLQPEPSALVYQLVMQKLLQFLQHEDIELKVKFKAFALINIWIQNKDIRVEEIYPKDTDALDNLISHFAKSGIESEIALELILCLFQNLRDYNQSDESCLLFFSKSFELFKEPLLSKLLKNDKKAAELLIYLTEALFLSCFDSLKSNPNRSTFNETLLSFHCIFTSKPIVKLLRHHYDCYLNIQKFLLHPLALPSNFPLPIFSISLPFLEPLYPTEALAIDRITLATNWLAMYSKKQQFSDEWIQWFLRTKNEILAIFSTSSTLQTFATRWLEIILENIEESKLE